MVKKYLEFLLESKNLFFNKSYNPKNLVIEICVAMVLLNNEFLDNLLDKGQKSRYQENSHVFLTDLKNLILSKNRLCLGKFTNDKFEEEDNLGKINKTFEFAEFNMEDDWEDLVNARNMARCIIDKLLPDEKLTPERISKIFWIGPNKNRDEDIQEDIVIETTDNKQYSIFLNKSISLQKTASFNLLADDLIGNDIDKLYSQEYLRLWNELTQSWIRIIYENCNKVMQAHIEKFINTKYIHNIGYFQYFDIKHRDPRFQHLGEFMNEFDKNVLKFSDLMNEIWKNRDVLFMDPEKAFQEWTEMKITILNSKILENLLTTSLKKNNNQEIKRLEDGFKLAGGKIKMKIMKTLVDKLDCLERQIFYVSKKGDEFYQIPNREFFRKYYNDMKIKFDYHVPLTVESEDEKNNFIIKIILFLEHQILIKMNVAVKFSGGEFSGKLSASYKFEFPENFNYLVSKKIEEENEAPEKI